MYLVFLESLGGVIERLPPRKVIVLLEDVSAPAVG